MTNADATPETLDAVNIDFVNGKMAVNGTVLVRQSRTMNCGQTAMMMLTGRSEAEVYAAYGTKGVTNRNMTENAAKALGCVVDEAGWKEGGSLPVEGFIRIGFRKRSGGKLSDKVKRIGHLLMIRNGVIYDPAGRFFLAKDFEAACTVWGWKLTHTLAVLAP
jgi:hypothetical protein